MQHVLIPDDESRALLDDLLSWRDRMLDAYRKAVPETTYKMACLMAEEDGAIPNQIVIGYPGKNTPYTGRAKQLICMLNAPMYPAWVHYAQDAFETLDLAQRLKTAKLP